MARKITGEKRQERVAIGERAIEIEKRHGARCGGRGEVGLGSIHLSFIYYNNLKEISRNKSDQGSAPDAAAILRLRYSTSTLMREMRVVLICQALPTLT